MKQLLLIFILCNSLLLSAQTWDELIFQSKGERLKGEFLKAAELMSMAAKLKGENNFEWYWYAANLYLRSNDFDNTFNMLDAAIDAGMYDLARWKRNKRLMVLHEDERWYRLIEKMKLKEQTYAEQLKYPNLRKELKSMWKNDQDLVGQWKAQEKVLHQNTKRLKEIITQYGMLDASMVGKDGTWMAWAIVQHSPDINFQKEYLNLLKLNLGTESEEPKLYAELYDRICKKTNEKQLFGMATVGEDENKRFYPILDEWDVDNRRKQIGLVSIKVWANENYIPYQILQKK